MNIKELASIEIKVLNSNQRYLKFPLTPAYRQAGNGERVRGQNVRRKFSDQNI
jgi:hypothetical protein